MKTHGHTANGKRTKEWRTWNAMWRRCKYPSMERFYRYGGIGITVCERWKSFQQFLSDVGFAPSEKHTLGRIDNKVGYTPENVKWETPHEQSRNKTTTRKITFNGKTMPLCDWAIETGLSRTTITQRIDAYGWSVEKALSTPKMERGTRT